MQSIKSVFLKFTVIIITVITSEDLLARDLTIATVHASNRGFIDQSGLVKGSSYDIMNHIANEASLTHHNSLIPYGRIIAYLETGKIDTALLVLDETVTKVAIPLIYIQDVNFIVVGKSGTEINQLEDLEEKIVGYLRLTPNAKKLMGNLNIQKVEGSKYTHMIEMLLRNRIDVLVGPKSNIYWALKKLNYSPDELGKPFELQKAEMHLVYSKKTANEKTISELIIAAQKLKKSKVIQNIINKYDYSISK